jgi:hypothetical protein
LSRGTAGSLRHFVAFGGPAGGEVVSVRPGRTTCSKLDRTRAPSVRYSYVLVDTPDGWKAFVPEDDQCLRLAFVSTSGEPGDRETETLAAEIQRRGLEI